MEGISQPPDYTDILRGSYLAGRAISRIIAVCPLTGTGPLYNSSTGKVKQIFKKIQRLFTIFRPSPGTPSVQHNQQNLPSLDGGKVLPRNHMNKGPKEGSVGADIVRLRPRDASVNRRAHSARPTNFNTPRPSKPSSRRAFRSRRTHPPASPAGRGCTGRTPPPPPSSSARTPDRRTTWSWRSRPGRPSSP